MQALDRAPVKKVFLNDFINVVTVHIGVPHLFRVDDKHRAFGTAVETTRIVDAYVSGLMDPQRLAALLGIITHSTGIEVLAATTAIFAPIGAEKYVVTIIRHSMLMVIGQTRFPLH